MNPNAEIELIDEQELDIKTTAKKQTCKWVGSEKGLRWTTSCGDTWKDYYNDSPKKLGMRFCPYCGGRLLQEKWKRRFKNV